MPTKHERKIQKTNLIVKTLTNTKHSGEERKNLPTIGYEQQQHG
jgi:hypothetical protein